MSEGLVERAESLRARVSQAAERADRDPEQVTIVAVSKTFAREDMDDAYRQGFRCFGESRVQEIREKSSVPFPSDLSMHMIGSLQTNKAKQVVSHIDLLETLDRPSLIPALEKALAVSGRVLPVLIQVNVAGEEQKSGVPVADARSLIELTLASPLLEPVGLMTMAPYGADESTLRSVFGGLRELRDRLQEAESKSLPYLSMGMSDDFEIAIEEGATHVRLGRSLFGYRALNHQ